METILNLVIITISITATFGIGLAIWLYIDTRNRHYKDYIERKRK